MPGDVISTGPVVSGHSGLRLSDVPPFVWVGLLIVAALYIVRK